MAFINVMINKMNDIDERTTLRSEFLSLNISSAIEVKYISFPFDWYKKMKQEWPESPDLYTQIDVFEEKLF